MALIAVGVAVFLIVIGLQGGTTTDATTTAQQATAKADRLSDSYGELAARVSALCQTGGPDVKLDAAELCTRAQVALADPEVNAQPLTPAQVRAIAEAAIAAQGSTPALNMDAIVAQVLAAVRNDTSLRGLDEATVRAIVESAIAAQPRPADGRDGVDGRPGSSFRGFERGDDGACFAVIDSTQADGTVSTSRQPASDAACAPVTPPTTGPPPPDPPSTLPEPTPTTDPPTPTADPATPLPEPATPGNGDGGLLGG